MFIDESGDHNLDPQKVQSSYPIFVLGGCIFEEKYYKEIFIPRFNALKKEFFGEKDIILHTLELTRPHRSKDKRYLKIRDSKFRIEFYTALNKLIQEVEFSLAACVIKKVEHVKQYGLEAFDPYLLSFDYLLSDFISHLSSHQKGKLIAERRDDVLDNQLELSWLNLKINGTAKIRPTIIKRKIENLYLSPKSLNEPGIQLADLVANPIGRHSLDIVRKLGHEVDFKILEKKLASQITILPK
jgi:hypothetical protein